MKPAEQWELLELAERYMSGKLSEEETAALDARLRAEPEAREVFAKALHLDAELRFDQNLVRELPVAARKSQWWKYAATGAGAACITLMAGWFAVGPSAPTVATLIQAKQCQWAGSSLPTAQGARLSPGTLDLIEGIATLRFDSGAEIVLEAPATVEVLDAMNCRLKRGTVVADVPPSAHGFSIDTTKARVVDWGTKFGLSTGEDGNYRVQVLEGRVDVNRKGTSEVKQLTKGQTDDHGWLQSRLNPDQTADAEPNRWQPNMVMDGGGGWQIISTAFGHGKDSYIQSVTKNTRDFGSDPFFRVKRSEMQPELNRKGYVAFDLSSFAGRHFEDAELVLTIEPSDLGFASMVPDSTFDVYGLTDETEDDWEENGLTWQHSPAHDPEQTERNLPMSSKAKLLGSFEIAQGVNRGTRVLRGKALRDFLAADTNRIATFIICRETDETGRGGLVHAFATKESTGKSPPLLRVKAGH
ncbi:MAG: hypothetical protein JWO08_3955 [Verrucomicrobiaceae bacterium]|nr:hypothetical protein [Verrucomicrobiaceae bacterium]